MRVAEGQGTVTDLAALRGLLDAAAGDLPAAERIANDPVRFPRRYTAPEDIEIAAVIAAMYAFGRADLFGPVVGRILDLTEAHGGPAAFTRGFDDEKARLLAGVRYRWNTPEDAMQLFTMLQSVLALHGSVGALVPGGVPASESLGALITTLRDLAPRDAPRSFRTWLAHPAEGSACKRWLMLFRWMSRHDDVDLGTWTHVRPRDLVIPLDTHVGRIARLLGLTRRPTADWRAAEEVTAVLRVLDPADPVRWDFALAHLGISSGCRGHHDVVTCPSCPIRAGCAAAR